MNKANLVDLVEQEEVFCWRLLMFTFQSTYRQLEKALSAEGLSVSRFQVLFFLYFEGQMNSVTLSRKLLVTRANMSMFLRRMESDELISFEQVEGQKRPEIKLTKRGREFFEEIFPRHIKRVRFLVKPFSKRTVEDLESLRRRAMKGLAEETELPE